MRDLPYHPNLRHLRRQARELQREAGYPLHVAQRAVATSYGFSDWAELKRTIEAGATVLDWAGRLLGKYEFEGLRDRGLTPPPSAIVDALRHPNPRVRYECLGLLDHLAEEESVPAMIAATSDSVPRVRRMAVHALGCQGCKQSSLCADLNAVFLPIAEHDPAWKVRREAVISIVQQDASERSRATLRKLAAADPHATVRKQACWALGLQERGMRTD
jgi:hypothetical protein